MLVQSFDAEGKLGRTAAPQVLWYKASMSTLMMATEMHKLQHSNLILHSWVSGAASLASMRQSASAPVSVTLVQIYEMIWKPILTDFLQTGASIANDSITFKQLDQVLVECGDQGDGDLMRKELRLMSDTLNDLRVPTPEGEWVEMRLAQIQTYRQLLEAAAAASAILKIAEKTKLSGSFTQINTLRQVVKIMSFDQEI